MKFEFIPATESDKPWLLTLRKLTMVEHLEKSGLFLTDEQHIVRLEDNYRCSFLIRHEGQTIGTLKYRQMDDMVEVMQLQIHPSHQNRGFGRAVLEQVIADAPSTPVVLTVLKDNPARDLYLRMGFKITGEDEHEYHMRREP